MTTTNFLGITVEGEITKSGRRSVEQKGKEELREILQPLLDDPRIEAIRWYQYTPYFNDGDACEFGVGEVSFKLAGVDEEGGEYEDGYLSTYDDRIYNDKEFKDFLNTFSIDDGSFDNLLLEVFGDHAQVTVTKDKITVDYYEHD